MKNILLLLGIACLIGTIKAQQPPFINDSLDRYIKKGMHDWQVPGLAIVIVKDGKVVTQKGYGVSSLQTGAPVDAQTLFMIASNTKLFTGTALALLEERGKLKLNDPVQKYFPEYRLYDSATTKMVTIRDLLTHRIGTTTFQGDFTFWNTNLGRGEIMKRMQLLKPAKCSVRTLVIAIPAFLRPAR